MRALYATDLSEASEATIENRTCLHCLRRVGVTSVDLITVIPSNVYAGMPGLDLEGRRKRALARYQSHFEAEGFDVDIHVVRGTPHRRINGIAETMGADLVLIGSRGKSPLENRIIGSTARNLARTTVAPLFIHRIERVVNDPSVVREHLFQRILFATDFSENAERAFRSFNFLKNATESVTLIHVETPKDPEIIEGVEPETKLAALAETLNDWDIETTIEVRRGDPATEILSAESDYTPSTVLVGSRGHSRLRRLLLGSVSEEIVANAAGNVLVVPPART